MKFKENEPLAPYTTFKIGGPADYFCKVENLDDLKQAINFSKTKKIKFWTFSGGSNVLVGDEGFRGLAIQIKNSGTVVFAESKKELELEVSAGENWDKTVELAVEQNLWGIENLSHIPGSSGAIAVQNVGAYGQEASQVVSRVVAFDTKTLSLINFTPEDFNFSYRTSIFNSTAKGRYIILFLTLRLSKLPRPNLSYRDLKQRFDNKHPDLEEIRQAIIEIRNKKFPFPKQAINGNVGSFFKNTIVNKKAYKRTALKIKKQISDEAAKKLEEKIFEDHLNNIVKIPTAFLLDICNLKNLRVGGAAINYNQPLVIINATGRAKAVDVLALANEIKNIVRAKTGIDLKTEPEFVGFN